MKDICYWRFGVGPKDCEEGFIPAAVGAGFFVTENEIVEQLGRVGLFVVDRRRSRRFIRGCQAFTWHIVFILFGILTAESPIVVRDALVDGCTDVDLCVYSKSALG